MLKNIISQGNYAVWSQIALVLFFMTFVGILCWVFNRKTKDHFQYMSALPNSSEADQEGEL